MVTAATVGGRGGHGRRRVVVEEDPLDFSDPVIFIPLIMLAFMILGILIGCICIKFPFLIPTKCRICGKIPRDKPARQTPTRRSQTVDPPPSYDTLVPMYNYQLPNSNPEQSLPVISAHNPEISPV